MPINVADLRKTLVDSKATWQISENFKDTDALKSYSLGGDLTKVVKATDAPPIDLKTILSTPTNNVFLLKQRIDQGFITKTALPDHILQSVSAIKPEALTVAAKPVAGAPAPAAGTPAPAGGTLPASVDWRNRYGWQWITEIKDQGPCESCWTFSAVGVVEAMTRIEHAVWSLRSEGDVHDGMGAQCATTGWPTHALDWMKTNGVADPVCWPYETTNQTYKPTSDRSGRTVRLTDYVTLGSVADQKNWLNNVGPLSACFTCYDDFFGYGSGVYKKSANAKVAGGHCIVIVGYDDSKQAWLVRNSWGTGWGMGGYCWFGYGECDMDANAKFGVAGSAVNPDPWTKRRVHNGSLYESGDGALHRNFEVVTQGPKNSVRHYWRDGSSGAWALAETIGDDCQASPCLTGTTYNRNFEYVYRTTANRLHHRFYDQASKTWKDGGVFGPTNVGGVPAFIQGDYNAPGNFELVVRLSDGTLQHWWRENGAPWTWAASATFGSKVAFSGPTLVQRRDHGLNVICVNEDGTMQCWLRDDAHKAGWEAGEKFGSGIKCVPVMIEGQYGATDETKQGNFELCVAVNGAIQHWWKNNQGNGAWANSATFGANVEQVLGLVESSYGFDLEVIAQLKDGSLQHFWRDGAGWHNGPVFGSVTK
jgi:hypothetical protein